MKYERRLKDVVGKYNKNKVIDKRLVVWLILAMTSIMVVACAKAPPRGNYNFDPPPAEWTPLKGEDGTLLFRRESPRMGITVYELCDRYQSAPLKPLSRNLFIGFEDRRIVERGEAQVSGKEAYYIIMECSLEGTPLKVKAYTLKANNCIYDLVYFSTPADFEKGLPAFEEFVRGFKV